MRRHLKQHPDRCLFRHQRLLWERLTRGEAALIDDIHGDSELAVAYRSAEATDLRDSRVAWIHAWAAIPLAVRDVTIGFLAFSHSTPGHFTEDNVKLARAVADQAAVAIANAQLFDQTQRQARDWSSVTRGRELFQSLNLDRVLQALVDVSVDVLGADKSLVMLHEGEVDVIGRREILAGEYRFVQSSTRATCHTSSLHLKAESHRYMPT